MVQLQAIMALRPPSTLPPGQSDQDAVAADTFTISDDDDTDNWGLPAFHEKWAPLGGQAFGTPSPSEASGYATHRERRLDVQVETLLDSNYRLRQKLEREQKRYHDFGALMIMVSHLDQRMEKLQQGTEASASDQHVQALLRAKNAEIRQLKAENEDYHFICNMATEHETRRERSKVWIWCGVMFIVIWPLIVELIVF